MADEIVIPIRGINATGTPTSDSQIVADNGVTMFRATIGSMADAVRPVASPAEAEAGVDNTHVMTAARVKESIASEVGVTLATAAQGTLASSAVQPDRSVSAGTGLTGGGTLAADRTIALSAASIASLAKADSAVQPARQITAGAGLTGGGTLAADRVVSLDAASIASLAAADSAVLFTTQTLTAPQQTLVRSQIGLGNVNNTTDANKPISTATQSALNAKANASISVTAGTGLTGGGDLTVNRTVALNAASISSLVKADTAVQATGTAAQYIRGDGTLGTAVTSVSGRTGSVTLAKADVGLANVDNTSDAAKPVSTATQTALNLKANAAITITAGTGLTGGGDLTANRTVALSSASIASLAKADTSVQPNGNGSVPVGGSASQVLAKASAADYDVGWVTSAAATAVSYAAQTLTTAQMAQARTNISAQESNAALSAISNGTSPAADRITYYTSATASETSALTAFARTILDDANGSAVWATLGATQSLGTNGYTRLPNGLILQWGMITSLDSGGGASFTFPISFPNGRFAMLASFAGAWTGAPHKPTVYTSWDYSLAGGTVWCRGVDGEVLSVGNVHWLAIGY